MIFQRLKIFHQNIFWSIFLVDNYPREDDFATIKYLSKSLVDNYYRGNDFATIKHFRP
jgi:hypothetical protein